MFLVVLQLQLAIHQLGKESGDFVSESNLSERIDFKRLMMGTESDLYRNCYFTENYTINR